MNYFKFTFQYGVTITYRKWSNFRKRRKFTFQYGVTITKKLRVEKHISLGFTFQYGVTITNLNEFLKVE